MSHSIIRSKRFWFGISYFLGLVIISYLFTWFGKDLYSNSELLLKNEDGDVIQTAPFNPLITPPFGSDRDGYNLFFQLIIGAKFTILFVFGICLIQILVGTLLGGALAYTPSKLQSFVQKVFKPYFFVPTVLWGILWMAPLMLESQQTGFSMSIVWKQFFILCIVTLPTVIIYISQEVNLFMKNEYIISSVLLGASKFYLFRKHIWLYLKEILVILFLQQFVQLFILLIHLAFFEILIGGRRMASDFNVFSLTNEWSSLIGLNKNELLTAPWLVLAPLLFFTISIFVLHLMIQGIKEQYNTRAISNDKKKSGERSSFEAKYPKVKVDKFSFARMNLNSTYREKDN
jgi:peptide/nickel transport system permease protein